jgi:chitodextrinase
MTRVTGYFLGHMAFDAPHFKPLPTAIFWAALLLILLGLAAPVPGASLAGHSTPSVLPLPRGGASAAVSSHEPLGARRGVSAGSPTPSADIVLGTDGASPALRSLNWTDPGSEFFTQYSVDESTNGSLGPWTSVGVVTTATTVEFAVPALSPGTSYSWEIVETYGYFGRSTLTSNVLNTTQPTLAYLTSPGLTSTSASFQWTNNASYGGMVSFTSYQLFEAVNGSTPALAADLTNVSTLNYTVLDLTAGTGYTFYLVTSDCDADCGTPEADLSATQSNSLPLGTAFPLTVSISAAHAVVDVGQPASFTCTPSGGVKPFAISWNFGNGTYTPGNGTAGTIFTTEGAPEVECQVRDGSSAEASAGVTLVVNAAPQLAIVLNRTTVDEGQSVSFSCTTINGTAPFALGWNFGDGDGSYLLNVTHAYSAAGTFVVGCSGMDGAGVRVAASSSILVSLSLAVAPHVNWANVAPGTPLAFSANATNGSGSYSSYAWTFGDGTVASGASVQHGFTAAGTFTVKVLVHDSNGAAATGAVVVTVSPVAVSLLSDPTSSQSGATVTFSASAAGGAGGPYNYTWNFGDGVTAYGAFVTHAYGSTGTFSPTLRVTDRLGAGNVTSLAPLSVAAAAATGTSSWLTPLVLLALAVLVGVVLAVAVYSRRRSGEHSEGDRMSSYVPPTDPSSTVSGSKVCGYCQTPNLPIRKTCVACGKPLPRTSSR